MTRLIAFSISLLVTLCAAKKDGTLTFVIDDTYSMYNDIEEVKNNIGAIVDIVMTNSSQIQDIVLVTFNDPVRATFRINTAHKIDLKNALDSIRVDGGNDCPEYALTGLKLGLEKSRSNSYIYVFTDATAKDGDLLNEVKNVAQQKGSQIVFVISPSSCIKGEKYSREISIYNEIARATSGQVFKLSHKNELRHIIEYVKNTISGTQTVIEVDVVEARKRKNIEFSVDDQTEYVLVSTSGQNVELNLIEGPTMTFENVTWIKNAKVIKIQNPLPGKYKIQVYSETDTSVMVFGRTKFTFEHGFSMTMPTSLNNTDKRPNYGTRYHLSILVDDPGMAVSIESVQLLNMERQPVSAQMPLRLVAPDLFVTEPFMPPHSMFLIAVTGRGKYSQRSVTRIGKTPIGPRLQNKAPSITIESQSESHKYNSSWTLDCKVAGFPKPKVHWEDESGKILESESYENLPYVYGERLKLNAKKSVNYYCEAWNEFGNKKSGTEVTVDPPLKEVDAQTNFIVDYGESKEIICGISSELPILATWYKNDTRLHETNKIKESETYSFLNGGKMLKIEKVTANEEGTYLCEVALKDDTNIIKQKNYDIKIKELAPKILNTKINYYGIVGDLAVRIPCRVSGFPAPTVKWSQLNVMTSKYFTAGNDLIIQDPTLDPDTMEPITINVRCEAMNSMGKDTKEFHVHVSSNVDEDDYGNKTYVYILNGKDEQLKCPFSGKVQWYKEGYKLDITESVNIKKADFKDDGNYTCRASSPLGTESHKFIVDVGYPPISSLDDEFVIIDWNGEKEFLDCRANMKPDIRTVQLKWEYNGKSLNEESEIIEAVRWGNYTCRVSNYHGSIQKTFQVMSSGCLVNKSVRIDHMPLMLSKTSPTWLKIKTNNGYWYFKNNQQFRMSCPHKIGDSNSFQNLPNKADIIVSCDHEDKFMIDDKTYKFSELQCKEISRPSSKATGKQCLHENTETIKVGFELDSFVEVYEVCFDNVKKVPLYTKLVIAKWAINAENLKPVSVASGDCSADACCLARAQLVNARDVPRGPAQLATIDDASNSVPHWQNCNSQKNWLSALEETIRRRGFILYDNLTVWSGASHFNSSNGVMVPRYLWKVARFTSDLAMAVVVVNDPAPAPTDVLCSRACPLPTGFKPFTTTPYSFTCCLTDFYHVFGIPESTFVL